VTAARTGELPVVEATREAADKDGAIVWVVRRCTYCRRRHTHLADPVMTRLVVPARCGRGLRFYLLEEVAGGRAGA